MENKIHLIDSEQQYYYVVSYYNDEFFPHDIINNVDISIFKINEWHELLDISKIFEQSVHNFNKDENDLYYNKIKESAYFIYYNCPFCRYSHFNTLDYNIANKQDIYERLFVEVRDKDKYSNVTIDLFRNWITKNLHNIKNHMKIIVD